MGQISEEEAQAQCITASVVPLGNYATGFMAEVVPSMSIVSAAAVSASPDGEESLATASAEFERGVVALSVSPYPCAGACSITFHGLDLRFPGISILGVEVNDVIVQLVGQVSTLLDADGTFSIPANTVQVNASGQIFGFGDASYLIVDQPISGHLDLDSRELAFGLSLADAFFIDVSVDVDVLATIDNLPPVASFSPPDRVECSGPGVGGVMLTSTSTDPDGNDLEFFSWTVLRSNGAWESIGAGESISVELLLGENEIALTVGDSANHRSTVSHTILVEDRSAPVLTDFAFDGPVCLWPPNHKYVVLRVDEEFTGMVQDVCDPAPQLRVIAATPSQPDNGLGDGDTTDDAIAFSDRVCLRAERQGTDQDPRDYEVHLAAVDAAGNASDPVVNIQVRHDQRGPERCERLDATVFADEGDPICVREEAADSSAASCNESGETPLGWGIVLALVLFWRRRLRGDFRG